MAELIELNDTTPSPQDSRPKEQTKTHAFQWPYLLVGLLFCGSAVFLIFSLKLTNGVQTVSAGILLAVGCGLCSNILTGEFKFSNVLSVSGLIGMVCFIAWLYYTQITPNQPVDRKKEISQVFKTFSYFTDFHIQVFLYDTAKNKTVYTVNSNDSLMHIISNFQFNTDPTPHELSFSIVFPDSSVVRQGYELYVLINPAFKKYLIQQAGGLTFHYNTESWTRTNLTDISYRDFIILKKSAALDNFLRMNIYKIE